MTVLLVLLTGVVVGPLLVRHRIVAQPLPADPVAEAAVKVGIATAPSALAANRARPVMVAAASVALAMVALAVGLPTAAVVAGSVGVAAAVTAPRAMRTAGLPDGIFTVPSTVPAQWPHPDLARAAGGDPKALCRVVGYLEDLAATRRSSLALRTPDEPTADVPIARDVASPTTVEWLYAAVAATPIGAAATSADVGGAALAAGGVFAAICVVVDVVTLRVDGPTVAAGGAVTWAAALTTGNVTLAAIVAAGVPILVLAAVAAGGYLAAGRWIVGFGDLAFLTLLAGVTVAVGQPEAIWYGVGIGVAARGMVALLSGRLGGAAATTPYLAGGIAIGLFGVIA